jgi:hypothetical protein
MRYAQIDGNNVCIGYSDLSGEVDAPHMIPIGPEDNPIGHTWSDGEWIAPMPPPPSFRSIDKVEAMGLIRAVTGMNQTEELAFRDDPNLALFWRIWREDVGNTINRDHPMTAQILDAVEGAGYLSPTQRQALLDNWPAA